MLTSAGPAYAPSLVVDVAEAESIASLVLGQPVVALAAGVAVPGEDGRFDGGPPGFDGGGQAVHFRGVAGGGLGVEAPQPVRDDRPVGVGAGQLEAAPAGSP